MNIGERTADTPAVRMADLTKGYRFTAELTKEQETYIGAGDEVTLTDSRRNQLEQLTVESVAADGENEGVYEISVPLPDDTLELGAAAVLDYSSRRRRMLFVCRLPHSIWMSETSPMSSHTMSRIPCLARSCGRGKSV